MNGVAKTKMMDKEKRTIIVHSSLLMAAPPVSQSGYNRSTTHELNHRHF